jgi:hypothetical protein
MTDQAKQQDAGSQKECGDAGAPTGEGIAVAAETGLQPAGTTPGGGPGAGVGSIGTGGGSTGGAATGNAAQPKR